MKLRVPPQPKLFRLHEPKFMVAAPFIARKHLDGQFAPRQKFQFDGRPSPLAAVLTSLTFVASAVSDATTATIPASAAAGDLAIAVNYVNNGGSTPSDVVPSGWTGVGSLFAKTLGATNRVGIRSSRKLLTGGDPGANITGMDGATDESLVILVFRPDATITTLTASTVNGEADDVNPTLQTVSASGQPTPLVVIGGASGSGGSAAFSTASPAFDSTVVTASGRLRAGYKVYNSSPADHSIDQNDLGSNGLTSFYLRVA